MPAKCLRGRMNSPKCPPPVCMSLGESQLSLAFPGGSSRSAGGLTQGPFKLLPLCWDWEYVRFFVCPLRAESLSPSALWLSHRGVLLPFKAKYSGGSSSWWRTLGLQSLMWGSDPSLLGENLSDYLSVCWLPTQNCEVWLYCVSALPNHLTAAPSLYL